MSSVFKAPPSADNDYIKRVIGLPGDSVQVRDGIVWLNGKPSEARNDAPISSSR